MLFADKIRQLRKDKKMLNRQLVFVLEIDTPMFSKIEWCDCPVKREQVVSIAEIFSTYETVLLTLWFADKIMEVVENKYLIANKILKILRSDDVPVVKKAFKIAEDKIA